jgi:hypothetical protein
MSSPFVVSISMLNDKKIRNKKGSKNAPGGRKAKEKKLERKPKIKEG